MRRNNQKFLVNCVMLLVSILIAFMLVNYIINFFLAFHHEELKKWLSNKHNPNDPLHDLLAAATTEFDFKEGACYTSNPNGFFPITITDPNTKQAWYCVSYDLQKRKEGYFTERSREAAIVGDSFTFGEGVTETGTLGYHLGKEFEDINFRNYGSPGAGVYTVKEAVEFVVENHPQVKTIIYFYNLNDAHRSEKLEAKQNYIIDFQTMGWWDIDFVYPGLAEFFSKNAFLNLCFRAYILGRETRLTTKFYLDMYFSDVSRKEFEYTKDILLGIDSFLKKKNIQFHFVVYPLLHKNLLGQYPFARIHKLLEKICRENNISFFDGINAFKGHYWMKKFIVHPTDYHPNGLSNQLIIKYLSNTEKLVFK